MNKALLDALMSLKEARDSDPRFILLSEREREMSASKEVKELRRIMDERSERYEEALLRDGASSPSFKEAQKALYEAKLALDSHPLVISYMEAYRAAKDIEKRIDEAIFGPFRHKIINVEDFRA